MVKYYTNIKLYPFTDFILFKQNNLFYYYNLYILFFNLLPIYPLDGSKIINVIFNYIFPFKLSHILTIILSIVFMILTLKKSLIMGLIFLFIGKTIVKEIVNNNYYFNKFLLERYLNKNNYKRKKIIKKIEKMKKQTTHKKYRVANKFRFTLFIVLLLLIFSGVVNAAFGSFQSVASSETSYIEVEVQSGDTIWDIARTYGPADADTRVVVWNIEQANQIKADALQPGQILLVPASL